MRRELAEIRIEGWERTFDVLEMILVQESRMSKCRSDDFVSGSDIEGKGASEAVSFYIRFVKSKERKKREKDNIPTALYLASAPNLSFMALIHLGVASCA